MATKRVNQIVMAATAADFIAGRNALIDTPEGTKRIPGNLLTFLGNVHFVSNAEYVYAVVDSNDTFLFGVRKDGSFSWSKGMSEDLKSKVTEIFESLNLLSENKVDKEAGKSLVNSVFASGVSVVSNDEYLLAVLDDDDKILFGVKRNGNFEWAKGFSKELKDVLDSKANSAVVNSLLLEKVDKEEGKSLISSAFAAGVEYSDTEFLYAIKDSDDHVLVTVGKDGSLSWAKGMSSELKVAIQEIWNAINEKVDEEEGKGLVDSVFASGVSVVSNDEYLFAVIDSNNVFLFGVAKDGQFVWSKGIPKEIELAISNLENTKVDKETGKGLISSSVSACFAVLASEYIGVIIDSQNKILVAVDKDGNILTNTKLKPMGGIDWTGDSSVPQLAQELKNIGFSSGAGDWSDASDLQIPLPKCARVNIKATALPTTKTDDIAAVIEFNDMQGNFFRKNIVINAQGASTMQYPKKNFSIDLLNEDESEFKLKIGKWVVQDGFHLKAFYTNFLKAEGCVTYDIYDEFQASRGPWHDVPWKTALINREDVLTGFGLSWNAESDLELRIDTGAVNHPLGFPCLLYFNGEFYGIYVFQLKKNRKNYHMTKSNHKEVHLDGYIDENNLLGGTIDWTKFEVRNPSGLKNMDGTKYDGDNPQEIKACEAKTYIENLSQVGPNLVAAMDTYGVNSQEVKDLFETHFDVDNVIDYIIFIEAIFDMDSMNNNWQWTTYDGVKWFLNPYDTDACFGQQVGRIHNHLTAHFRSNVKMLPVYYIYHRTDYNERLEARYKYLRDSGIYSISNFMNKVNTFVQNVGFDAYKAEYQKWVGSFGDSNMDVNSTYWEVVTDGNGKPVEGSQETWDSSVQYEVGDVVEHRISSYFSYNGIYTFRCVSANRNKLPVLVWKIRDSYWRMIKWMEDQFTLNDSMYHYAINN